MHEMLLDTQTTVTYNEIKLRRILTISLTVHDRRHVVLKTTAEEWSVEGRKHADKFPGSRKNKNKTKTAVVFHPVYVTLKEPT